MTVRRLLILLSCLVLTALVIVAGGCSPDSDNAEATKGLTEQDHIDAIQAGLTEVITRWRYGDKSGLYENEFPYLRARWTFEEYLSQPHIAKSNASSIYALNVENVKFYGLDSARVSIEAIQIGPRGDTTRLHDEYPSFYYEGRWIRPTISNLGSQLEFEKLVEQADSAAQAEEEEW